MQIVLAHLVKRKHLFLVHPFFVSLVEKALKQTAIY